MTIKTADNGLHTGVQLSVKSETIKPRTFKRHNVQIVVRELVRKVHTGRFTSQRDAATHYNVDHATIYRWKQRALSLGLTDEQDWERGFKIGQLARSLEGTGALAPATS